MSALEYVHREGDLEFHLQIVKQGPSRYTAFIRVDQRIPGIRDLAPLIGRRHLSGIECASAVTAESLALRAARDAAHERLGRSPAAACGAGGSSWLGDARTGQLGTAFGSGMTLE